MSTTRHSIPGPRSGEPGPCDPSTRTRTESSGSTILGLLLAAALVVGAVACGDDDTGSESASTTTTTPSSGPSTTLGVETTKGISYGSDGGFELTLDAYVPKGDAPEGGWPVVVAIHGGGWNSGDSSQVAPDAEAFAAAGIASFAINYDLDDQGRGRGWPDELNDVFDALTWVADNADRYDLDTDRVGVYGSSAGGNLAMLAATRRDGADGPVPKAVVSWSGPTDLTTLTPPDLEPGETPSTTAALEDAPPGCADDPICIGILAPGSMVEFLGCSLEDCRSDYEDASPVTHVGDDSPPMYLVSFEEDLVPLEQQHAMADALEKAGVAHHLQTISGEGHAEEARPDALAPSIAWFHEHL